jgi:hypothetical protein
MTATAEQPTQAEDAAFNVANFVIGGTEKAGTTSVFAYLSAHPEVSGSLSKETDFFRQTDCEQLGLREYATHFRQDTDSPIIMEASPGYLGLGKEVAPRISQLLPGAKLLFILRDPVDRLYSSYNFHHNKLDLPQDLDFQTYVQRCLSFQHEEKTPEALGLDAWYLQTMQFGCYADHLEHFSAVYPKSQIKVMFFEDLGQDAGTFMQEVGEFLDIDNAFWQEYEFERKNVTFSGRNKALHKLAMYVNGKAERFLRQRPALKSRIVSLYKSVNQDQEGYDGMDEKTRELLCDYYRSSNERLSEKFGLSLPANWQ